jgi:hypothetical protein
MYIYRVPQCMSPRRELGLPQPFSRKRVCPTPLSRKRVCLPGTKGWGTLACAGEGGGGGVPIPTTGEKPEKY